MTILDRRSGDDRRGYKRYSVNIDVEWEASGDRKEGTISDLSINGCFVMCSGEVEDGELVKVYLPLTVGMKAEFVGEVVNHAYEIGFAMRFLELTESQSEYLQNLLENVDE